MAYLGGYPRGGAAGWWASRSRSSGWSGWEDSRDWPAQGWTGWRQDVRGEDEWRDDHAAAAAAAVSRKRHNPFDAIGVVSLRAPGLGQPEFDNFVRAAIRRSPEPGDFVAGKGSAPVPLVLGRDAFCVDYFLNYEERLCSSFNQHSEALNCWRRLTEDAKEPFASKAKWFDNAEPTMVSVSKHPKETSFTFKGGEQVPWRWQEMVATLRKEDIMEVVLGPRSSGALIGCSLEVRPNSYDHTRKKTVHASEFAGQRVRVKLPMWDFVLHRDDGTGIRLHPRWGDRKVTAFAFSPRADTAKPPRTGLDGSLDLGVERALWFDAARETGRPTPSQRPRSSGAAASNSGA